MGGGDDEIFSDMFSSTALKLLSRTVGADTSKHILRDSLHNVGSRPTVWLLNDAAIRIR